MVPFLPLAVFLFGHAALGLLLNAVSIVVFFHAIATVLIALRVALTREPERLAPCLGYITGCEVLWRMTTDRLPWELGKYAVVLVSVVAIVRHRGLRSLIAPLACFSLLLPSAYLTVADLPLAEARQQLSFNLSGPLALVICARFFQLTRLSFAGVQRLFLSLVGPAVAIAAIALFGILTNPDIQFNTESNFSTSGGFGPNQVSSMLGLGALAGFFCLFLPRSTWPVRFGLFAVTSWLATQSALTFSRGGIFAASGAALVSLLFFARDRGMRLRLVAVATLLFLLGKYEVWPRLDQYTGGTITERFTETDVTRRDALGSEDLTAWNEHPILGIGPGRSSVVHDDNIIAHTEFTRLLAEHGLLGGSAIGLLLFMGFQNVRRAGSNQARGLAAGLMTWSCLFMLNSAMRTAAPSFLFGLAFAGIGPLIRAERIAPAPSALRAGLTAPVRQVS